MLRIFPLAKDFFDWSAESLSRKVITASPFKKVFKFAMWKIASCFHLCFYYLWSWTLLNVWCLTFYSFMNSLFMVFAHTCIALLLNSWKFFTLIWDANFQVLWLLIVYFFQVVKHSILLWFIAFELSAYLNLLNWFWSDKCILMLGWGVGIY